MSASAVKEKPSKSRASRLGNSALILSIAKFGAMAVAMATGMIMARFRTLDENGTLSQLQTSVTLITTLLLLGTPNSLNYFVARADTRQERKDFLSVYYTFTTVVCIICGLILVLIEPYIEAYFSNPSLRGFIYFLAVFPWASVVSNSVNNLLVAYGKTPQLMFFRLAHSLCYLGVVLLVQYVGRTFSAFMIMYTLFESVFAAAVYIIAVHSAGRLRFSLNMKLLRKILAYSIPIGLAAIVSTLNIEMDKLLIGYFFSTDQLGIYSYCARELPVTEIPYAFSSVLLPHFARLVKEKKEKAAVELWSHAIYPSFALISLIAAGCFVFAPDVIELLYSAKYLPGVGVFRVYSLLLILRCTYFGLMLNTTGHTKFITYSSVGAMLLNAVLNIALYYPLGFIGPAVATIISVLTVNLAQLAFSVKIVKVPFSKIFPWASCARLLLLNSALGVAFYFIKKLIPLDRFIGSNWESVVLGAIWAAVMTVILLPSLKRHWKALNSAELTLPDE